MTNNNKRLIAILIIALIHGIYAKDNGTAAVETKPVSTVSELLEAIDSGAEGLTIELAEGTYALSKPLEPKSGMTIRGAGAGKTIITHEAAWKPSVEKLPDPEMSTSRCNRFATSRWIQEASRQPRQLLGITLF